MLTHKNLRRLSAVSALTTTLCSFGALASAAEISWADWGLGREVASGKMVKWTINKDGAIYLNNARNGWGWTRCKQKNGFRGLHVAAFGSKAFVTSDNRRVVPYIKHARTGVCLVGGELKRPPVLVRDLAFDGRNLVMIGEDGETYRYTGKGWSRLSLSGKSGLTAFNQKSSKFFGNVVCDWPARKNTFIFTDTKHKRGIIGGRRANPGHAPVNAGKKPGGTDAVWVIERLDSRQCLYRLRSFVSGQYLIAGDAYNGGLYIQPHQNRTNALWRIVTGLNGAVSLVDYKHGRAITAGDRADGKLYHQELTPVSLKSKLQGRKNQWWDMKSVGVEQYQPQKAAQNKPKCDFPRNGVFRLDDTKHKRSLRWRDGNHGAGHLQDAAAWYLKKGYQTL